MELWKAGRFTYSSNRIRPIGRLVVSAVPEAGAMVLVAGHFSATGAESRSTTNSWPAPLAAVGWSGPPGEKNLAEVGTAGLAKRRIVASGQNAPKPQPEENLPTRLSAPAHFWGRFPAGASGSVPCLRI